MILIVCDEDNGPHRRLDVLTGSDLVVQLEGQGVLPRLLVDHAIDSDLRRRQGYEMWFLWSGHILRIRSIGRCKDDDQQQRSHSRRASTHTFLLGCRLTAHFEFFLTTYFGVGSSSELKTNLKVAGVDPLNCGRKPKSTI